MSYRTITVTSHDFVLKHSKIYLMHVTMHQNTSWYETKHKQRVWVDIIRLVMMSIEVQIDGLVQERRNSIAKHWSYVFLALSHRNISRRMIQLMHKISDTVHNVLETPLSEIPDRHFKHYKYVIDMRCNSGNKSPTLPECYDSLRQTVTNKYDNDGTYVLMTLMTRCYDKVQNIFTFTKNEQINCKYFIYILQGLRHFNHIRTQKVSCRLTYYRANIVSVFSSTEKYTVPKNHPQA